VRALELIKTSRNRFFGAVNSANMPTIQSEGERVPVLIEVEEASGATMTMDRMTSLIDIMDPKVVSS